MKKIRLLLLITIAMIGVMALSACSLPPLTKPRGLHYTDDTAKLEWNAVEGARSYVVEINNDDTGDKYEEGTRSASLDLSSYPSGNYSIRVKAAGDKYNNSDSIWSDPLKIKRYYQSGLNLRLINSGTAYEVTGIGSASNNLVVPSDYRDIPITRIADGAFNNSTRLKTIIIPDTVTEIGDRAFRNCSDLESVVFSDNITSIGANAFQSCSALVRITLPEKLVTLRESAFAYCNKLSEINFNDNLRTVGKLAFRGVPITEVVIPDSVVSLGDSAFAYCSKLKTVYMGKSLTTIGPETFRRCASLEDVYFDGADWKSKLSSIDTYAFADCTALKSIVLPDSVMTIGSRAFSGCSDLSDVKFGANLYSLGRSVFEATALWNKTNADFSPIVYVDNWVVGCKRFDEGKLEVAKGTVGIASYAFHTTLIMDAEENYTSYNQLQDITLPDTLKYIGTYAFNYCVKLKYVRSYAGETLHYVLIDEFAFNACEELQSVNFGDSLRIINNYAFAGCTKLGIDVDDNDANKLSDVDIPSTLEQMGANPFEDTHIWNYYEKNGQVAYAGGWVIGLNGALDNVNVTGMTQDSYNLRKNIIGIANYAFSNTPIVSCDLPASIAHIGLMAFGNCISLESITVEGGSQSILPGSFLTEISNNAFYNCAKLNVAIPESITRIGTAAFYHCAGLKSLNLGNVTYIGDSAFSGTTGVISVTLSDNLTYLGVRAFYGSGVEKVNLPATLSRISDYAFANCQYLNQVTIANKVADDGSVQGATSIGSYAFSGSKALKEIVIPGSVKTIENYAFRNCTALAKLTLEEGVESLGNSTFAACESLKNLNFPASLKTIGNLCFRGCTSLGSVVLRSTIENMGMHVFFGCNPVPEEPEEEESETWNGDAAEGETEDDETEEEPEEEIINKVGGFTIYTDMDSIPEGWSIRWNTARSPVIFGCVLDQDNNGDYFVYSFVKDSKKIVNVDSKSFADVPTKAGFTCIGFSTVPNGAVEYDSVDLMDIADGVTLYPIWAVI